MAEYNGELSGLQPDSAAPREGVGINVKRLLKLRSKLVIVVFILLAVPLAALVMLLIPREFKATANIEFNSNRPGILQEEGSSLQGNEYYNYVNTQLKLLTTYPILSQVLENPKVQDVPFIKQDGALPRMFGHVEAALEPNSEMVTVSYRDQNRDVALKLLDAILEEYGEYVFQRETNQGDLRRRTLVQKEDELKSDIERMRAEITDIRKATGLPLGTDTMGTPEDTESLRMNLAEAETALNTAQTMQRQAETLVSRTRTLLENYQRNPAEPVYVQGIEDKALQDPRVTVLLEQLAQAEQEYAKQRENYVDAAAPQIEIAKGKVDSLESSVDAARARARGQAIESLLTQHEYDVTSRQEEVAGAQERRDRFQTLLDEQLESKLARSSELATIAEKERIVEALEANLADIQNTLLNMEIESNAPARANIVSAANAPEEPDMSRRLKFLALALVLAAGAALGIGVLMELADQTIRSSQDISYVTSIPVIATVPHATEDRLPKNVHISTVAEDFPSSMTTDEFRQVVARILNSARTGSPIKTCVVTSSARGDGKSTLSCNLAIVLAQADRRVLLLDIDSRNPSVEHNFGLARAAGLAEILGGEEMRHDPDRATDYDNLYVMGPGLRSEDLVERLASPEMRDFLDGAEELFDHIIIDTPATLLTAETRLLTYLADGVIVVVGAGVSSFGMLRRCISALESSGSRILGIVLNSARQSPGGYLRRNIDLYYSHVGVQDPSGRAKPRSAVSGRRSAEPSIVLLDEGDQDR